MKQITRIYQFFSLLNLDVVVGVVGFVFTAMAISPVEVPIYQIFILSSTVWMIYTTDRMLDSFRNAQISTTRHVFQYANRKASLLVGLISSLVNLLLILIYKPLKLIWGGMVVTMFVFIYLLMKQVLSYKKKSFLLKEIFIASGYSIGIMLLPFSNSDIWYCDWSLLMVYIFFIALVNVFVIGVFEKKEDLLLGEKSMVHCMPSGWVASLCIVFSILNFFLAVMLPSHHPVKLVLLVLPFLLVIPLFFKEKFAQNNLYRLWEDGMLMLPFLILTLHSFL